MSDVSISVIQTHEVVASARSTWTFVEVTSRDGIVGFGEATVQSGQERISDHIRSLSLELIGCADPGQFLSAIPDYSDIVDVNARCALDQALNDIAAQRAGLPIWRCYAQQSHDPVAVYANVNRRTFDRSPEGFAQSARDALAAGADAVKIAPFDGLKPRMSLAEATPFLDAAFARIHAVRGVVKTGKLMVDCHWRLSAQTIDPVLTVAKDTSLFWVETPFIEDPARFEDIRCARVAANAHGILLAGCELKAWETGFAPFLEHELYDVLMPDMKYVGGYAAYFSLARAAKESGVAIAPHNPSGPICHAHSVHVSAVTENFLILEMQFDETHAFLDIVGGYLPMPSAGAVAPSPGAGLGVWLRQGRKNNYVEHA